MEMEPLEELQLWVNGVPQSVSRPRLETSLAQHLRSSGLTGTKLSCGVAACGSCTVLLSAFRRSVVSSVGAWEKYSHDLGRDGGGEPRLEEVTVTSCSVPLASCHGAHVTTVEGLGSTRRGLHPVQVRPSLCMGNS